MFVRSASELVCSFALSGFSGMEWWTGMVDWNGGMEWFNGIVEWRMVYCNGGMEPRNVWNRRGSRGT